jgi:hypothetical protein
MFEIYHDYNLGKSKSFKLFSETYLKSIENGHSSLENYNNILNSRLDRVQVVYCCDGENVISGIAFEIREVFDEAWIIFTFTDERYRGKELNKLLRKHLENYLIVNGITKLCSYIHPNNVSSLKSSQKAGSVIEYYKTIKHLL